MKTAITFDSARASGVRAWANNYPYTASANDLASIIPSWAHAGGKDSLLARLRDPATRALIRRQMTRPRPGEGESASEAGSLRNVVVLSVLDTTLRRYQGKRITEIAIQFNSRFRSALEHVVRFREPSVIVWLGISRNRGPVNSYREVGYVGQCSPRSAARARDDRDSVEVDNRVPFGGSAHGDVLCAGRDELCPIVAERSRVGHVPGGCRRSPRRGGTRRGSPARCPSRATSSRP